MINEILSQPWTGENLINTIGLVNRGELMSDIEGFNMPDDLYYHKEHAWVKVLDDGTVKVGMSDFYQKNSGDTTYIDLPFEGDGVEQGETCGKIQSAKWVGKFAFGSNRSVI